MAFEDDYQKNSVEDLEQRLYREFGNAAQHPNQIIPYVQKYEFENLLFSDVEAFRVAGHQMRSFRSYMQSAMILKVRKISTTVTIRHRAEG